ncbi:hypothetical protein PR202_ga03884 [Eleusine coracana subsp. coracana]|uniref:Fatty acyl-CoA reductase C-terminal domain-containing protein n=1 Tax=Eleusine coracana subsp. coracana TaxID=191504 RepID=A0AAV5BNG6_ELECO|nr:hypothetical protein PR202_ga03884 [Eleusine coracana subsp. coracana]
MTWKTLLLCYRTIDAIITAYAKENVPRFIGDADVILDLIPGDMVVNAMMVAMAFHWNEKGQVIIHVTSSLQNPLSTSSALEIGFDDTNLARLQAATSSEAQDFNCDPKSIDWEYYFHNIHIPGVLKYGQKK